MTSNPHIVLPEHDRLGVLSATAPVVRAARLVRIVPAAVEALADRWAERPWPEQAGLDALHFSDGTPRTANWVLLLDALNFCFWGEPGQPRWQVEWHGQTLDGYAALAAALTRATEEGRPLWDAAYLANIQEAELREILRPVPGSPEIPLSAERLAHAREVGRVLNAQYGGQFTNAVAAAGSVRRGVRWTPAPELALLLARDFPSFHDVAHWQGREVPFLKRAQICVADLHAAFRGHEWGALASLDELTAFADYKLPQLLRRAGVLVYAEPLARRVAAYAPIAPGSEEEIEIRAATIWAVELLRRALALRGIERPASAIDYRLWEESQTKLPGELPYHRTRTIYY
ncbi:MAG TPA: queuosine salvage family protein [Ktedonobacterales bacterium]